jgi:hypothetical protein
MIKKNFKNNRGFVILFAVTLAAILLSIALGVANIALKEIKFGTSARDTNDAFFAADVGIECALINDKSTSNVFVDSPPSITCNNNSIIVSKRVIPIWDFVISGLGNSGQGCAKVVVDKTSLTEIIAKGYNNGGNVSGSCAPGSNAVEREIKTTY